MAAVPHIVDDGGEEAPAVDACTTTERSFQSCDGVQGGQNEIGASEEQRAESRQTRLQPIRVVDYSEEEPIYFGGIVDGQFLLHHARPATTNNTRASRCSSRHCGYRVAGRSHFSRRPLL